MNDKQPDPVKKRNALLIVGGTILLIAILVEPAIILLLTSKMGLLRIVFAIVSGAVFAIGMNEVGEMALRSPVEPWYARPGAALLITVACGMIVIGWILYRNAMGRFGTIVSMADISHFFACLGLGLILITVLNWVSYEK